MSNGNCPEASVDHFQGAYAGEPIPNLVAECQCSQAERARASTSKPTPPDPSPTRARSPPCPIRSPAINGNNAQVRVIIDGSHTGGSTGLVLDASQSVIRGLAIEGFGIGIAIPDPTDVGDMIQGNFIGPYLAYPVDQTTGDPLPAPDTVSLAGAGQQPGRDLAGLGQRDGRRVQSGREQRDFRQRCARGLAHAGSFGQPGPRQPDRRHRPIDERALFPDGNGADGVWIQSSGTAGDPASIVYSSSNVIGGAVPGSGNVISVNNGYGVHLSGVGATRNLVEANYIGVAPGGGQVVGTGNPGNSADGVRLDDAPDNQIGGLVVVRRQRDLVEPGSRRLHHGRRRRGQRDREQYHRLDAAGSASSRAASRQRPGRRRQLFAGHVDRPGQRHFRQPDRHLDVGRGRDGCDRPRQLDRHRFVGHRPTWATPRTAFRSMNASGTTIEGDNLGVQVISGNLVGIEIDGSTSTQNLIQGNLIGTDKSGTADRGNSNEGILIEGAFETRWAARRRRHAT